MRATALTCFVRLVSMVLSRFWHETGTRLASRYECRHALLACLGTSACGGEGPHPRSSPSRDHVLHLFTCEAEWSRVIDVSNQNITLSLPEEDLREARILAASRGTSVSQLLARMLKELIEQETGYTRARNRSLARLREGMDLGTGGHIGWSRDSVHER
jgi:hypothetical protein